MPLLATIGTAAEQAYGYVTYAKDQFFNLVTTLISGSGTNAANNNTILDSSSNAITVTRNGNVAQGTFTPFSRLNNYWSAYFGGVGNYCSYAGAAFTSTTTTFTVEAWIYMTATPGVNPTLVGDMLPAGAALYWSFGPNSANKVTFLWNDGASKSAVGSTVMSLNTWYHIAVSVNANDITMYVNGNQETLTGTTTLTNRSNTTSTIALGQAQSSTYYFIGYAYNISILSGTAKYSGSFTPSTAPLSPSTTNQVFLLNGGNSLRDANTATTAKVVTVTGAFMRATPTSIQQDGYQYATYINGGSMFFDGSGDTLTIADNALLEPGTSNFCIEMMYYPMSVTGTPVLLTKRATAASGIAPILLYQNAATLTIGLSSTGASYDIANLLSLGTVNIGQWNHVAIYRVANAWYGSLNGTITTLNASNASTFWNNAIAWVIGGDTNANYFNGHISNFRMVIGSSVYTSSSAPIPTAPLTAITNTQLLLSGTNAGIYDASGISNVETAGSAQISNANILYGNGSVSFNGTTDYLALSSACGTGESLIPIVGNFTIEGWVNPTNFSATKTICHVNGATAGYAGVRIDVAITTGIPTCYISTSGAAWAITLTSATALTAGVWTHFAVVRSGTTFTFYLNGVSVGSSTAVTAATALMAGTLCVFGATNGGSFSQFFVGYMSYIRITQFARYTSTFTPPTGAFPIQG
jgi:hypothetical protein